jgi:SAM-dependent methyltransferase
VGVPDRAELYDAFLGRVGQVPEIVAFTLRFGGGRWLDARCGTGRLLGPLGACGREVVGVDADSVYVARARSLGHTVHHCWFTQISSNRIGSFDGVLICNGPLAYVLDDGDLRRSLQALASVTSPGGVLVSDTPDLRWILQN